MGLWSALDVGLFAISACVRSPATVCADGRIGLAEHGCGASVSDRQPCEIAGQPVGGCREEVYGVGNGGAIRRYDGTGTSWATMTSTAGNASLGAVFGYGGEVYGVGSSGTSLHCAWTKDLEVTGQSLDVPWAGGI